MEKKKPLTAILLSLLLLSVALGSTIGQREVSTQTSVYKNGFFVGASYMTFWETKMNQSWSTGAVYWPINGTYSSNDTSMAKYHIELAVNHGIDFFYLDYGWADPENQKQMDDAAKLGLLKASNMTDFKFCIFYHPDEALRSDNVTDAVVKHFSLMNEKYFNSTSYLQLDNENNQKVVILADFPRYFENLSHSEINDLFYDLKMHACVNHTLYLIPAFWPDQNHTDVLADSRTVYDAITLWGSNTILEYDKTISYSEYLNKTRESFRNWSGIARSFKVDFVPLICPGYNNLIYYSWGERKNWSIVARDPKGFREICELAKAYSKSSRNMVLLFTWNDFKEATCIEPTTDYQYEYLKITSLEFLLVVAFGSKPEDFNWNQAADQNNDDVVDIFDIVLFANNF